MKKKMQKANKRYNEQCLKKNRFSFKKNRYSEQYIKKTFIFINELCASLNYNK